MRHVFRLVIILPFFVLIFLPDISFSAQNQKIALVIGNGAYKSSYLRNPVNDATNIAYTLKKLGFKVILKINANQRTMKKSIRTFGKNYAMEEWVYSIMPVMLCRFMAQITLFQLV